MKVIENLSLSGKIWYGFGIPLYTIGILLGLVKDLILVFIILLISSFVFGLILKRILVRNPTTVFGRTGSHDFITARWQ